MELNLSFLDLTLGRMEDNRHRKGVLCATIEAGPFARYGITVQRWQLTLSRSADLGIGAPAGYQRVQLLALGKVLHPRWPRLPVWSYLDATVDFTT